MFGESCFTLQSVPTIRLAALEPATLAMMHGSSYSGEANDALIALADDERGGPSELITSNCAGRRFESDFRLRFRPHGYRSGNCTPPSSTGPPVTGSSIPVT